MAQETLAPVQTNGLLDILALQQETTSHRTRERMEESPTLQMRAHTIRT